MKKVYSGMIPVIVVALCWLAGCQFADQETGSIKHFPESLRITLIDSNPSIVTPIGLCVDEKDRLFVLESHTHTPSSDYAGAKYDRIKIGIDHNQDGDPDEWQVFADSITDGMNLVAHNEDKIFLVEKDRVLLFRDSDGDLRADQRKILVQMTTPKDVYDHAGLLGITLGPDDWLYISRGNVGGMRWKLTGTDDQFITGFGDGGNVFRCRTDGSDIEEIATGFWNPFDLAFDAKGHLLLTDNDPDSRGPNRLIQIVPGGDYGYKSLYGGSGIHPYLAWNGELPGTLPFAAPLGEAPCGLIDGAFTNLPKPYNQQILATIWEENTMVGISLEKEGKTLTGTPSVILQGDSLFHPVAMAVNSKGDLYISDWMIRQYPNHGKGRIWKISGPGKPRSIAGTQEIEIESWQKLRHEETMSHLVSGDPVASALARKKVIADWNRPTIDQLINSENESERLQGLIIANEASWQLSREEINHLLRDTLYPEMQQMSLIYLGRQGRNDLLPEVQQIFREGLLPAGLLDTYLATIRHLQPDFIEGLKVADDRYDEGVKRQLPESYLGSIIQDNSLSPSLRAAVIPHIHQREQYLPFMVTQLKTSKDEDLIEGIIMSLRTIESQDAQKVLLEFASDLENEDGLRSLAIVALNYQSGNYSEEISTLLHPDFPLTNKAILRYLQVCGTEPAVHESVQSFLTGVDQSYQEMWSLIIGDIDIQNLSVQSSDNWFPTKTDADAGKIVFNVPGNQCLVCHKVDGWGGEFGPGLSNIGNSKTREQLISAILEPSREMAPEWQGWFVTDADGVTHFGRQIDVSGSGKNAEIMIQTGEFVTYKNALDYGLADVSLMPEGLEHNMTKQEFGDLIAYLESLK